jgi:hypothetical protein
MDALIIRSPVQLTSQKLIRIYLPCGRGMPFSICLGLLTFRAPFATDVLANLREKKGKRHKYTAFGQLHPI